MSNNYSPNDGTPTITPTAQKLKKLHDILGYKNLNIWQKTFLMNELNEKSQAAPAIIAGFQPKIFSPKLAALSSPAIAADAKPQTDFATKVINASSMAKPVQIGPAKAVVKNPFTYLNLKPEQTTLAPNPAVVVSPVFATSTDQAKATPSVAPTPGPSQSPTTVASPTVTAGIKPQAGAALPSVTQPEEIGEDYDAQNMALAQDNTLDSWEKTDKQQKLDRAFGKSPSIQSQADVSNATKLKAITDQINQLDKDIKSAGEHMSTEGMLPSLQAKRNDLFNQLGPNMKGLDDYGYGSVDPSKMVDVKLDNKDVGNARYQDGKVTGDLGDAVKGFGGSIDWNNGHTSADIRDKDGKVVSTITVSGDAAYEKDSNGYIMNKYTIENGQVQTDIAGLADKMGVPYSYYHDNNGVYHAYAQPEERDAPIQVVRKDGQVYIDAYIFIDDDNPAIVKKILESIDSGWNDPNNNIFNIDGTPQGQAGGETVQLKVNVHAIDKKGISYNGGIPSGQKHATINLNPNDRSHVYTTNSVGEFLANTSDALKTGELEKVMYDWKIADPGNMWISRPEDSAHEFGHLLGVGDAYGENGGFYRIFSDAPPAMARDGETGQAVNLDVPNDDLMRGGNPQDFDPSKRVKISAADVFMAMTGSRYDQPQYFDKNVTPQKQAEFAHWLYSQVGINLSKDQDESLKKLYETIDNWTKQSKHK